VHLAAGCKAQAAAIDDRVDVVPPARTKKQLQWKPLVALLLLSLLIESRDKTLLVLVESQGPCHLLSA
jgi:hypothetical protein